MTAREEKPPTIARRSPEGATEDAPDSPEEHRAGATAPGTPDATQGSVTPSPFRCRGAGAVAFTPVIKLKSTPGVPGRDE